MLLSRACLQQLSEACPQLSGVALHFCTLDLGALLGLLPLANSTAPKFELVVNMSRALAAGACQGYGLLAEVTLFCSHVQRGMVLGFRPEVDEGHQIQALRTLLETYQPSIMVQHEWYYA
eukprot:CAMPEP_0202894072 /NCGR_PEP_ID=MMETSP1392-20130828/3526_1 /ASSEMBLY_ACC=CAM_ASM_000868 /TAXON_ID=225041 /ORGANISM="Chlamydomonas chlamydogama, Strain SAG 11-48b" /LENGTH=119 /DNA_ID=CAMNT_0049578623 /DNA_START=1 /DNA_END=360 /DNA_ORIENTATION=+